MLSDSPPVLPQGLDSDLRLDSSAAQAAAGCAACLDLVGPSSALCSKSLTELLSSLNEVALSQEHIPGQVIGRKCNLNSNF
jgi:hypothetical protein